MEVGKINMKSKFRGLFCPLSVNEHLWDRRIYKLHYSSYIQFYTEYLSKVVSNLARVKYNKIATMQNRESSKDRAAQKTECALTQTHLR